MQEYLKLGAILVEISATVAPIVESLVTLFVLGMRKLKLTVPAELKVLLAGVLSVGGALGVAVGGGLVPPDKWWLAGVFGLAAWMAAHGLHKASADNEASP